MQLSLILIMYRILYRRGDFSRQPAANQRVRAATEVASTVISSCSGFIKESSAPLVLSQNDSTVRLKCLQEFLII